MESLGKAALDLEANLAPFEKGMKAGKNTAQDMQHALDAVAAVANLAEAALNDVKMKPSQGAESKATAESIISGVRGIGEEARRAARDLDDVKLDSVNAAETTASGDLIDRKLKAIVGNANEARRSLESVRLAGVAAAGAGGADGGGRNGVGFGPFGSGFGRIGVLGAALSAGTLLAPSAGPGAAGLLAAIPVLAASGAGALGTLALAFQGVGKAIGGDKKAFDDLGKSAQGFVLTVRSLDGWFDKLKETAGASLFPGLTAGLKSALSPGTLSAITQAVQEFGRAIGEAGAAWGRYFGSAEFRSIFGPLMQAGAHNLSVMSDAALRLFDALGVLGRAAIPLTEWIVRGVDAGARWADTFLHAKDATGALGGAMNEAKTSLQLVGNLLVSIGRAVGALGEALYPVSKIAVKDLTDGLNALAGIIDRNKQTIRDIVSGALAALVQVIKLLSPIVGDLVRGLDAVAHAIGGWKVAFEIILGGMLAVKFVSVAQSLIKVEQAAQLASAEVGGLRGALLGLAAPSVIGALAAAAAGLGALIFAYSKGFTTPNPTVVGPSPVSSQTIGGANVVLVGGKYYVQAAGRLTPYNGPIPSTPTRDAMRGAYAPAANNTGYYQRETIADANKYGVPAALLLAQIKMESGFNPGAVSPAGAIGIAQFMPGTAKGMGVNPQDPTSSLAGAARLMSNYYKKYGRWDFALAAYNGGPGAVDYYLKHGYFPAHETTNYVNSILGSAGIPAGAEPGSSSSAFGADPAFTSNLGPKAPKSTLPTGANLLPQALRNALQAAKDKALTTQGATAEGWLKVELADLEKAKKNLEGQLADSSGKKKIAIEAELRNIDGQIASVTKGITTNLHQQAATIKQSFTSQISSAKSSISGAVSTLKSTLGAQLQQHLQDYIDTVLGPKFFQGTDAHGVGLQTPLEKQLADMQAADQLKSLQDAVTGAADPAAQAAAQRQLDEYNLSIKASAERAQADHDYAAAVKQAQADEAEQQRQLNNRLDVFGNGLANGTTQITDLAAIVGTFGLSLTADGGIVDDFGTLQSAVQELSLILATEAKKLIGVSDTGDTAKIQTIIDKVSDPYGAKAMDSLVKASGLTIGDILGPGFGGNPIPRLDTGGTVKQTGLAIVDRTETFSGVGANRRMGDVHVHLDGPAFVGNEAELAIQIGRVLQSANERGFKFGID